MPSLMPMTVRDRAEPAMFCRVLPVIRDERLGVVAGERGWCARWRLGCAAVADDFDPVAHNRAAWDREVENDNEWTRPVGPDGIARARAGDWSVVLVGYRPDAAHQSRASSRPGAAAAREGRPHSPRPGDRAPRDLCRAPARQTLCPQPGRRLANG